VPYRSLPAKAKQRCYYCGQKEATQIVALRADLIEEGKHRGKYLKTVERRLCDDCALRIFTVHANGPRRREDQHLAV
jgi:hypothetical protein